MYIQELAKNLIKCFLYLQTIYVATNKLFAVHFAPCSEWIFYIYFNSLLQEFYLTIVLLLGVSVTAVVGRSTGAPTAACTTITPGHGDSTATGPVPYIVNISSLANGYVPEQSYTSEYCTCYKET